MEIRYQVGGMSEFGYGDPFRFIFNSYLGFPLIMTRVGAGCILLEKSVGYGGFKYGHMED